MGPKSIRLLAVAAAVGTAAFVAPPAHAGPDPLNGLFALSAGVCANGVASGSFFRMILPTGTAAGPYLQNSDSRCSDRTVTPLSPGSDGGLVSGSYQPQPAAAFDPAGNARSGRVTTPVRFYGVDFATATNPTDPQTGVATRLPQVFDSGGTLSGDLSSLGVTWNNQVFNQGAPKPGGSLPGKTSPVHGTIDNAGNFVLEWTSQIVGGPFNNFTGLWHLAGRYQGGGLHPAAAPVAPSAPGPVAAQPPTPAASAHAVVSAQPGAAATVAQTAVPATVAAAPSLATRTIELPRRQNVPAWVVPALIALAVVAAGIFVKAGSIAGRK